MFDNLMNEVAAINKAYGYTGVLDAIVFIQNNLNEYDADNFGDERVLKEFRKFMVMGQQMFKEVA
jgi:hypothetical protein